MAENRAPLAPEASGVGVCCREMRTILLAFLALAAGASGQTLPLVWEPIGSLPNDSRIAYSVDHDGSFLTGGSGPADTFEQAFYRLPPPHDATTDWELLAPEASGTPKWVVPLGGDTLLAEDRSRFYRSLDRGRTWTERGDASGLREQVYIVPEGIPFAGYIIATAGDMNNAYSSDRGATWRLGRDTQVSDDSVNIRRVVAVTSGPHAGRLLGGGLWGITASDDGGATWQKTAEHAFFQESTSCIAALRGGAPDGGDRFVTVLLDQRIPVDSVHVSVSDDAGETWRRTRAWSTGRSRRARRWWTSGAGGRWR